MKAKASISHHFLSFLLIPSHLMCTGSVQKSRWFEQAYAKAIATMRWPWWLPWLQGVLWDHKEIVAVHMLRLRNPQIDGFPFNIEVTVYQPFLCVKDLWLLRKGRGMIWWLGLQSCGSFWNLHRVPLSETSVWTQGWSWHLEQGVKDRICTVDLSHSTVAVTLLLCEPGNTPMFCQSKIACVSISRLKESI